MEEAGGIYHVLNRGNYRRWLFEQEVTVRLIVDLKQK
jgi:hypothetical protein